MWGQVRFNGYLHTDTATAAKDSSETREQGVPWRWVGGDESRLSDGVYHDKRNIKEGSVTLREVLCGSIVERWTLIFESHRVTKWSIRGVWFCEMLLIAQGSSSVARKVGSGARVK